MQRQLFLKLYKEKAEKINVPFSTDMGIDPSRDDLEGFDHESQYNSVSGKSLPCASESNVTDKNTEKKKKKKASQINASSCGKGKSTITEFITSLLVKHHKLP